MQTRHPPPRGRPRHPCRLWFDIVKTNKSAHVLPLRNWRGGSCIPFSVVPEEGEGRIGSEQEVIVIVRRRRCLRVEGEGKGGGDDARLGRQDAQDLSGQNVSKLGRR